jgi:predicted O-methyltransferase YrrM
MIIDAEPWAGPYREDLRCLLLGPSHGLGAACGLPAAFEAARHRATIARWNAGANAWRRWTENIGALRARFERQAGAERLFAWLGFADFSDHCFPDCVDLGTLELPLGASFARAKFADDAWFANVKFRGRTDFCGAQFLSRVSFENSHFEGEADFRGTVFLQSARFTSVCAYKAMSFRDAEFCMDAWFRYSRFRGQCDFSKVQIGGEAGFGNCLYAQDVDFSDAEFCDNAGFEQSIFSGRASFSRACFGRKARFENTTFSEKPGFTGARFYGSSHFEQASMPASESPVAEQLKALVRGLRPLLPLAGEGASPSRWRGNRMSEATWSAVDDLICDLFVGDDPILAAALAASDAARLPAIAVAPNQGKLLNLLARLVGAQAILEIGTLGGYSTIWLGRALDANGRLITLEANPKHADVARANIERAGLAPIVDLRLGPALETLPQLAGPFDLIFIDADKENNAAYFRWALKLSRRGSLIIVDNVVRDGKVVDAESRDPMVKGTRRLYEAMAAEPRVSATVIQTVGRKGYDGLAIALVTRPPGDQ